MATPLGVTLEMCGDVKAEEVQAALALEYQEEELGNTMLTVQCRGEAATLRIIGPNHPIGRIVDVNLAGIEPVARSRTIAVLAAELWTAPEPSPPPRVALVDTVVPPVPSTPRFGPLYRNKISASVDVLQSHRSVYAGRSSGRFGANGNFSAIGFNADWPVFRWIGIFAGASVSSETTMAGHAELNAPVRWRRSESGIYIPVWRKRFRLDLRFSTGADTITAQGVNVRNSFRTILPRYRYSSIGTDMAYVVNEKSNITAWGTTYRASTTDTDYTSLSGSRWGLGMHYQVHSNMRAGARIETLSLSGNDYFDSNSYSDRSTTLGLSLSYTR
jgi:hypothetical protein